MKSAVKGPGNVYIPPPSTGITAVQGTQSVEIDISDVALAPDEGPPPIPLKGVNLEPPVWSGRNSVAEVDQNRNGSKTLSAKGSISQFSEISPWQLQESEGTGAWPASARSRQNTAERIVPSSSSSSTPLTSQAGLPNRSSTPPFSRERESSGSAYVPQVAPGSSRRSKNPLNFFRKKSSVNMKDEQISPPIVSGKNSLSAASPGFQQSSLTGSSLGLEENFRAEEQEAKGRDRRRLVRPRTRDKEGKRNRVASEVAWNGGPIGGAGSGKTGNDTEEVQLALDTNFDQMDDIVNPSMMHSSSVGPMNEPLSPLAAFSPQSPASSVSTIPILNSPPFRAVKVVERSGSVSFADWPKTQLMHSDLSIQRRPFFPRLESEQSETASIVTTTKSFSAGQGCETPPAAKLRRLTNAEAQNYFQHNQGRQSESSLQARTNGDLSSDFSVLDPQETMASLHRQALSDSDAVAPEFGSTAMRDYRKESCTSSSSMFTSISGISPTTSISNLRKTEREKGDVSASTVGKDNLWARETSAGGLSDSSYRFPQKLSEEPRKSSASSGQLVQSSWMAPDSWAVQPDNMRDALRDEDDDDEEQEKGEGEETSESDLLRDPPSGISPHPAVQDTVHADSLLPAVPSQWTSTDGDALLQDVDSSLLQYRRGTQDSTSTGSSNEIADLPLDDPSEDSTLEIMAGTSTNGSNAPTPQSSVISLPNSKHGSKSSAISGAAAAAAGKLKLRPRMKINIRPATAGSFSAQNWPNKSQSIVSTPTKELEGFGNWKVPKRPSTATTNGPNKNTLMRVYRNDGTHTVVTLALTSTTTELRTILSRKRMDSTTKRLFVRDKGSERPLGELEKPAILQRRRFEQAGYIAADGLDELGREDMSYLLKFVFRPDSVTKLESSSFGDTETDYNRLDLQNKNLEMIPISLYRHADWIQSLDLSGNPMSDIPLDFVQLCSHLTTLRLSHLALKRIPQSIRKLVKLTHLDISDNRIPDLSHINLNEIPNLSSLKAQNNRLSELPSYFGEMRTLRDLHISNNRFEVFPSAICKMASLVQLDISFNTIAELPASLGNLTNLQRLVLVGNVIVKLPDTINQLVNLQAIDVRRNLLTEVSDLFALPKMQVLQCEHNSVKNLNATFGVNLRKLEIGQNPLSKASFRAQDICALTSLNLSSANMGRLDEEVFSRLPNLTHLVLDKNTLIVLPDNLGKLTQLRKLSCSNNLLATLPDSLGQLLNLEELQVHNNNLKTLPASVWLCGKLHSINVSSNLLESFPDPVTMTATTTATAASATSSYFDQPLDSRKGSISSLGTTVPTTPSGINARQIPLPLSSCLIRLRLGDNRLTEDILDVLGHLNNLQVLNLSCNEIYELPNYGLSKHVNLTELYLSGNSLNSIPADVLHLLRELRILHLNCNKLQTLPAELGYLKKLVNLDVGNNQLKYNISNQQYDWNWNKNPDLRYLNLSGNKRLEIKSNPSLIGAEMRKVDSSDFQRLHNLRLLSLMDVTVTLPQMPDQFEDRRIRTSLSQINHMAYGISDALGKNDHLSIVDVIVPQFRKLDNECIFGLFADRGQGTKGGSRLAYHLAEWIQFRIQWEVQRLQPAGQLASPELDQVADIFRRAFLRMEKEYADVLISEGNRKKSEVGMASSKESGGKGSSNHHNNKASDAIAVIDDTLAADWKKGATAVLAYVINRTLFIANVGDSLAVLSRNSQAVLISTKHEPFDRSETLRIRSAEGWVSLHGRVNDKLDISRSFGHYHLAPIVNASPAVTQVDLTDSDEFVILANRTLWDFISYQTAVDIARMERDDPMVAAQKLRDFAISYGAEDSIMIMIVAVGDLFERSRNVGGSATNANGNGLPFGLFNETTSAAYDVEQFKKMTHRRVREDRDLPGDRTLARLQREVAPPIGHVALVFTDIKNSTALWETNGGMQSAMRIHNFLLRRQLRNIGGYEVKTEGDAFMVSFQNVTSALLWCFQVQIHLLKEIWPQELLECEDGKEVFDEETGELIHRGLSVRMGIHWGWPVCEADPITRRMDYFGPMVNRASRISGAADGGQIMASKDVVNELRAIMGTFDEDNKTSRQLNADATASDELDEVADDEVEEAYRILHPNVGRDVILLRRIGFAISCIGERRLKGLEMPEVLNLVYPKVLTRRHTKTIQNLMVEANPASNNAKRLSKEANALDISDKGLILQKPEVFEATFQLLHMDEVQALGFLCFRLEAVAHGSIFKGIKDVIAEGKDKAKHQPLHKPSLTDITLRKSKQTTIYSRQMIVESYINRRPELSLYGLREDATDEELYTILKYFTTRIWTALGLIAVRRYVGQRTGRGEGAEGGAGEEINNDAIGLGTDVQDLIDFLNQQGGR
ncbi:hypothetical protein CBS101457_001811 [Exobasidium rhododendri]|nr:hypothetical protein CBS101457_001811 [Exobasidium rhododendri]